MRQQRLVNSIWRWQWR